MKEAGLCWVTINQEIGSCWIALHPSVARALFQFVQRVCGLLNSGKIKIVTQ